MDYSSWWLTNFATAALILAPLIATYVPHRLLRTYFNHHVWRHAKALLSLVNPYVTVDISRRDADDATIASSDAYDEVRAYLTAACSREARALRAQSAADGDGFVLTLRGGSEELADEFRGAVLWWSSVADTDAAPGDRQQGQGGHHRLTFHRRYRQLVVDEYLPHVRRMGRDALFNGRRRRLYSNNVMPEFSLFSDDRVWNHIDLKHPTTFDTLAMDPDKKRDIMDDLDAFRNNREFYRRTGKPWKRGYLLYGPPGTGKSTMIAAMATYLNYDIYDVELTVVRHNHDLRKLLVETTDRSIVVIEDIDCSLDLTGDRRPRKKEKEKEKEKEEEKKNSDPVDNERPSKVTLSGLLNFIDSLWSACGGERIIVFTTNHVDKLDPALVRRGRMDMHIEMSYCGFEAFETLAKNYLDIDSHPLFDDVRELLQEVNVTPADVAECLMTSTRAGRGVDTSLQQLLEEVKTKAKAKTVVADDETAEKTAKSADGRTGTGGGAAAASR